MNVEYPSVPRKAKSARHSPPASRGLRALIIEASQRFSRPKEPYDVHTSADRMPDAIKERLRWAPYILSPRPDGKSAKIPVDIGTDTSGRGTCEFAEPNDPSTFRPFGEVVEYIARHPGRYSGMGCLLQPPFVGVDFDDQMDVYDDRLLGMAAEIVPLLDSYSEVSRSGRGAHTIVEGRKSTDRCRNDEIGLEVYEDLRFFIVTGYHLAGTPPEVRHNQAGLDELCRLYLPSRRAKASRGAASAATVGLPGDDGHLIQEAINCANDKLRRIAAGDWPWIPPKPSGEPNWSSIEFSVCSLLCYWTGPDPVRLERVLRLFLARYLPLRPKHERDDYIRRTVANVIARPPSAFYSQPTGTRVSNLTGGTSAATPTGGGQPGASKPAAAVPVLRTLDKYVMRPVSFVWPGWLPLGEFVLVQGDGGEGKGNLLLDICGRVTRGDAMPDGSRGLGGPAPVIWSGVEDTVENTVKPRAVAAGVVPELFHHLDAMQSPDGALRPVSLPADLAAIEAAAGVVGAKLIVIDPLLGHTDVDANSESKCRPLLTQLKAMAMRLDACVIGIRHLNKSAGSSAAHRGGGSVAWRNAARSELLVGPDPDRDGRKVLFCTKHNLAKKPRPMGYEIVEHELPGFGVTTRLRWHGVVDVDPDASVSPLIAQQDQGGSLLPEVMEYLRDLLSGGRAIPSGVATARIKQETGASESTIRRAREALGVTSRREDPRNRESPWVWELPGSGAQ